MKECPKCGGDNLPESKYCNQCGCRLEETGKICSNPACGKTGIPLNARFCPECGSVVKNSFVSFIETVNKANFEMIAVKGGTFKMGNDNKNAEDDEKPVHPITVNDFYMSKFPVTVALFKVFIKATAYETDAEKQGFSIDFDGFVEDMDDVNWKCNTWGHKRDKDEYNNPVIHISWNDAAEFCRWLSVYTGKKYRLPTEAEWEYAAGYGTGSGSKWAGTNTKKELKYFAWYDKNADDETHPCGLKNLNSLGFADMSGNVLEWCDDWYNDRYYLNSVSENPLGPGDGAERVLRGGCWCSGAKDCRVTKRFSETPDSPNNSTGFRIVCDL